MKTTLLQSILIHLQMYLHKRFLWRGSKLLRHSLQFLLMILAWYTVMTRVSDYKHHWSDVLAGFAIGIFYAVIIVSFKLFFCYNYIYNKYSLTY